MFLGHFGLAFGAKKAAPAVSLGALFAACQFADLLWPTLLLLGYEHVVIQPGITALTPLDFVSYPYSHSLLALCGWAIAFGAIYVVLRRARISASVTIAALVVSHWLLDYITHRPDLPLTPRRIGAPRPRLVEFAARHARGRAGDLRRSVCCCIFASPAPRDRIGSIGLWALVDLHGGGVSRERVRTAAAEPGRGRVVGAGDVAARRWGYWVDNIGCGIGARRLAMGKRDPRVDAYIKKAAPFAQPILTDIREIVHAACPDVEETMKWSFPHFLYKGMLCSMASFKEHAAFGFWKGSLVTGGRGSDDAMGHFGRITKLLGPAVEEGARRLRQESGGAERRRASRCRARRSGRAETGQAPADLAAAFKTNSEGAGPASTRSARATSASTSSGSPRPRPTRRARGGSRRRSSGWPKGKSRNWKYETRG